MTVFADAAALAIDETGDPTDAREALTAGAVIARRPQSRAKRVAWAASQIVAHADNASRAYKALRELVAALYEPIANAPRQYAPAPEVALTLSPSALLDAIAAPPRVLAGELARLAKPDASALIADPRPLQRVLGVRVATVGKHAAEFAALIVGDPDPGVRAEALRAATESSEQGHTAVAQALRPFAVHGTLRADSIDGARANTRPDRDDAPTAVRGRVDEEPDPRVAAIHALHALHAELPHDHVAGLLADDSAAVRTASARVLGRGPYAADVEAALVANLAHADPGVRLAALGAISRGVAPSAALVEPLIALAGKDGDTRPAVYLLGKLASHPRAVPALQALVLGPRSDVALAATLVLREVGAQAPEPSIEDRLARAQRELASTDYAGGILEARRLGRAAIPLAPALGALGDRLAADDTVEARAALSQIRELLGTLGISTLPRAPSRLEGHRGATPVVRETHGAYIVATLPGALGLWDAGTGKKLVVVDGAVLLAFVPGRAEIATLDRSWRFARCAVPSGEPRSTLAIPEVFTHGTPTTIAIAANMATVWCDESLATAYRFHIKLGDPDRVIDDTPVLGRRSAR